MFLGSWLRKLLSEPPTEEPTASLCSVLLRYEIGLSGFDEGTDSVTLLPVLVERDQVATVLEKAVITPEIAQHLVDLDRRLRQIGLHASDADWDVWRQTFNPPRDRWWWWLDETQTKVKKKRDLLWLLVAGMLMTITLGLAVEIIQRVWGGGPDRLAVFSTVLTLALTGGPLTKQGRELVGWLMDKVSLPTRYRGETMLAAAFSAFSAILILYLALPVLATYSNNRGYALLQAGDLTRAQQAFQRAVSINPDYAAAYYNLADAYVKISDYDQARSLYYQALTADRTFDLAYNGLGYVLILQGEPKRAIPVLYGGLDVAEDDAARIALWINLGWAYLATERFYEVEAVLAEALSLDPRQGAAHCVLALTAEALERADEEVAIHWEDCLRYVPPTLRGKELAAMARAHLYQIEEGR